MNKITVTINEKECTLKFTMHAMITMQEVSTGNEYDSVIAMVWAGLHGWARVNNTELPVNLEEVTDYVEAALLENPEQITAINDCMTASNAYRALIKAGEEEAAKKK